MESIFPEYQEVPSAVKDTSIFRLSYESEQGCMYDFDIHPQPATATTKGIKGKLIQKNQQLYIENINPKTLHLLYDFSLKVGDSTAEGKIYVRDMLQCMKLTGLFYEPNDTIYRFRWKDYQRDTSRHYSVMYDTDRYEILHFISKKKGFIGFVAIVMGGVKDEVVYQRGKRYFDAKDSLNTEFRKGSSID